MGTAGSLLRACGRPEKTTGCTSHRPQEGGLGAAKCSLALGFACVNSREHVTTPQNRLLTAASGHRSAHGLTARGDGARRPPSQTELTATPLPDTRPAPPPASHSARRRGQPGRGAGHRPPNGLCHTLPSRPVHPGHVPCDAPSRVQLSSRLSELFPGPHHRRSGHGSLSPGGHSDQAWTWGTELLQTQRSPMRAGAPEGSLGALTV